MFREAGAVLGIVAAVLLLGVEWGRLPARVPTHFGWSGAPDGYGSRMAIWGVVVVMVLLYLLVSVVSRYPRWFNLPVARGDARRPAAEALASEMMSWLKLEMMWLFVYVIWAIIRVALSDGPGVRGWFLPVTVLLVGGTIFVYFRKIQQVVETRI